ncbi:hypothetical protein [Orrella marina]|nr:hypothetical protein [Orrella marina]
MSSKLYSIPTRARPSHLREESRENHNRSPVQHHIENVLNTVINSLPVV